MTAELKEEIISYLGTFVSEKRLRRFNDVASRRLAHMRIVLEDMYQAHNASAVLRSCDCFGIQHVHFIENRNHLRISDDVAMGSSNWLSIHRHRNDTDNSATTLLGLKKQGFCIVATSPHADGYTLESLPVDKPLALVFGTEIDGISEEVRRHTDKFVTIPMFGFTESFNVSVSAAISMYELSNRIRRTVPGHGLSPAEQLDIRYEWLMNSIDKSEALVADYLEKKKI